MDILTIIALTMIKEGEKVMLLENLSSNIKDKRKYGMRGDEVKVISVVHYPVLIVEDSKENLFPVHENKVCKIIIK